VFFLEVGGGGVGFFVFVGGGGGERVWYLLFCWGGWFPP